MKAESATVKLRNRGILIVLAGLILWLGWSARVHAASLPFPLGEYAPDTLWALLVFLGVLLLRPSLSTRRATLAALFFSYAIECSQLYQAPWIVQIRATRIGGLVLGHGFLWSDLLCYSAGIAVGAVIDARFRTGKTK